MSFAMTTAAMIARTKTVTRRVGASWRRLRPTEILQAVEKAQGLKKGEKVRKLHRIRVLAVRQERLDVLLDRSSARARRDAQREIVAEGFPDLTPAQFVEMFCAANACKPDIVVTRIEFEHLGNPPRKVEGDAGIVVRWRSREDLAAAAQHIASRAGLPSLGLTIRQIHAPGEGPEDSGDVQ